MEMKKHSNGRIYLFVAICALALLLGALWFLHGSKYCATAEDAEKIYVDSFIAVILFAVAGIVLNQFGDHFMTLLRISSADKNGFAVSTASDNTVYIANTKIVSVRVQDATYLCLKRRFRH